MIIDSSVIVAALRFEVDGEHYARAIRDAANPRLSAASYLEVSIVLDAYRNPILSRSLDDFLHTSAVIIEPVTAEQAKVAREAYRDFGRGSGHPAKLNFGDCFSYALARVTGEPLLFKGNDFVHTDLRPAAPPA